MRSDAGSTRPESSGVEHPPRKTEGSADRKPRGTAGATAAFRLQCERAHASEAHKAMQAVLGDYFFLQHGPLKLPTGVFQAARTLGEQSYCSSCSGVIRPVT